MNNFRIRSFVQWIVSGALLGLVFMAVDVRSAIRLLRTTDLVFLGLGVMFIVGNKILMAYRWNILIRVKGIRLSLGQALKICLIANFFGSFLPSGIGGDVYRIYHTAKQQGRADKVAASVVMERFIGMVTRSAVALFGVMLVLNSYREVAIGKSLPWMILGFCALNIIGFWVSIHDRTVKTLMRLVDWCGGHWFMNKILKFQRAYVDYKKSFATLTVVFVASLLSVFLVSLGNYYAAKSMNIDIELIFYFGFIAIINIVNRIPISVGGLGLTEGAYVVLFSSIGASTTEAFALSLLARTVEYAFVFGGWLLYIMGASMEDTAKDGVGYSA